MLQGLFTLLVLHYLPAFKGYVHDWHPSVLNAKKQNYKARSQQVLFTNGNNCQF